LGVPDAIFLKDVGIKRKIRAVKKESISLSKWHIGNDIFSEKPITMYISVFDISIAFLDIRAPPLLLIFISGPFYEDFRATPLLGYCLPGG
jgi:hypothetical protein